MISKERIDEIILALEEAKAVTSIDPEMADDEIEALNELLYLRNYNNINL
jgi:hypothetical protein